MKAGSAGGAFKNKSTHSHSCYIFVKAKHSLGLRLLKMSSPANAWGSIDVEAGHEDVTGEDLSPVVIREEELLTWAVSSLVAAGAEETPARIMANILLSADRRGHYSHGFNRLDIYYNDIRR